MKKRYLLFLFSTLLMMACKPQKEKADLILHHAKIYTVDNTFSILEAMAVKDGMIEAVGTNEEILNHFTSDKMIDAQGKAVYPGFNDAHCHFYGYGTNLITRADLVGTQSFDEVIEGLKKHAATYP